MSRYYEQGPGEEPHRGRAPRRDYSPEAFPDERPQHRAYGHSPGPYPYPSYPGPGPGQDRLQIPAEHVRPRSMPPQHAVIPRPPSRLERSPSRYDRSPSRHPRSSSRPDHRHHSRDRGPIGRARHAVDSTFTQTSSGLGVGLLGAVVGGLAASAHSGRSSEPDRSRLVSTVVGALVGGLGANAIEKRFENARERHRREQEAWERKWRAPEDRPRRGASRSREPGRRDSGWGGDDDFGMQGRRAPRRLASQDGFQYRG